MSDQIRFSDSIPSELVDLRENLVNIILDYHETIYHEKPYLEAKYTMDFGSLECIILDNRIKIQRFTEKIEKIKELLEKDPPITSKTLAYIDKQVEAGLKNQKNKLEEKYAEIEWAYYYLGNIHAEEGMRAMVNQVYRQIIAKAHPIVNPNLPLEEDLSYEDAKRAFSLYKLEELAKILHFLSAREEFLDLGDQEKLTDRYQKNCKTYSTYIKASLMNYPFTEKDLILDPANNEEKKQGLRERVDALIKRSQGLEMELDRLLSSIEIENDKAYPGPEVDYLDPQGKKRPKSKEEGVFLLETHIAGTTYVEDIDLVVSMLSVGDYLNFVRDEANEFDKDAIMVTSELNHQIGFVPRKDNKVIASLMDAKKVIYGKILAMEKIGNWWQIVIGIYLYD